MNKDQGKVRGRISKLFNNDINHPGRRATDPPGSAYQAEQPAANEETDMRDDEQQPDPSSDDSRIENVQAPGAVIINGNVGDNNTINAAPTEDASAASQPGNEGVVERPLIPSTHPNHEAIHPDLRDGMQALHEFMMLLRKIDR